MRFSNSLLIIIIPVFAVLNVPRAPAQDSSNESVTATDNGAGLVSGRPFSAMKYARTVRVLADGKQQFVRNDSYPVQIARDAEGRVRMQVIDEDELDRDCDKPTEVTPPACPAWTVFVVNPVTRTISHWTEGEAAAHITLDMPLSQPNLERAIRSTSDLPDVAPKADSDTSNVTITDLRTKIIDGVSAHGIRTTVLYPAGHAGNKIAQTRIHEVWVSPTLNLIVRVVDGNPEGVETIRGLEKISVRPEPSLFSPPAGYESQHQSSDIWAVHDFDYLDHWFAQ